MKGLVRCIAFSGATAACLAGLASPVHAQTKVVVDPGKRYQVFEGWGTSLCWWAVKAGAWSEANRGKLLGAIADPDTGLGYTIFRYNIGGGDQPGHNHLDKGDGGANVPGYKPTEKGDFDWTADPYQRTIAIELSKRVKDPIFEADDFADYLSEVALHFKKEWGITFRTVEPFNEPSAGWWKANGGQEGCGFKNNQTQMIVELGKALKAKGLFPETSVSAADETNIGDALNQFNKYSSEALSYMFQVNTHSYSGGDNRAKLFNAAFAKDKKVWQSETGPLHKSGDENIALWMAGVILADLRDMKASAWVDWQIGDPAENWRSLALNHSKQTFTPNARYYMHAAFSRFIRPGSRIIDSDNGNTLAAVRGDSALVLVVRNSGSSDVKYEFDLRGFDRIGASAKVYRFELPGSLTPQSDIAVADKALSMTAKANTVTTMVIEGAGGGVCKPDTIVPYVKVHDGGWNETTEVEPNKGDSLVIGPHPWEGGRWVWSGPNDFKSTDREIRFKNMDGTMSGYYKAVHTNASGCENSVTIKVVVDDPEHPFVEPDTTDTTETIGLRDLAHEAGVRLDRPLQVFDMQGRFLGTRLQAIKNAGTYLVRQGSRMQRVQVK